MAPPPPTGHSKVVEINLISAEDLAPVSKNMKTYAVVWVQPDQKLATGVDQTSGTDPTWNERFVFKVDDKFLNSEDATIVVEIYAAAWVKDALVGYVNVNFIDIFHLQSVADAKTTKISATRTVTLQIRRPSGRPQGILKMEVALVDSTHELEHPKPNKTSGQEMEIEETNSESQPQKTNENATQRDRTELTNMEEKGTEKGSIVNCGSGSSDSTVNKGYGSMVNGDSLCNSDVGPSASIVAAAIAKGLYVPPVTNQAQTKETAQIREWTKKEREEETLNKKLERWRQEIQPDPQVKSSMRKGRKSRRGTKDGTRLFSCFGGAFGCEISISCGPSKRRHGTVINNKICHLSSVDDNCSQLV